MCLESFRVCVCVCVCVCGWFAVSSYYSVNINGLFACGVCLSICVLRHLVACMCISVVVGQSLKCF